MKIDAAGYLTALEQGSPYFNSFLPRPPLGELAEGSLFTARFAGVFSLVTTSMGLWELPTSYTYKPHALLIAGALGLAAAVKVMTSPEYRQPPRPAQNRAMPSSGTAPSPAVS